MAAIEEPVFEGDRDDPPVQVAPVATESEEDVSARLSASRASLSSTDWTIETIVRQMRRGRIDLNPKFQRRAAWTNATKSRFIESAVLAYPIPQLVLAELPDRPGHFSVIDGKQRLLALRQFYAGQGEAEDEPFDRLELSGLTVLEELKGYGLGDLESTRGDLFDAFENHTIRTVVVRNWESEAHLRQAASLPKISRHAAILRSIASTASRTPSSSAAQRALKESQVLSRKTFRFPL